MWRHICARHLGALCAISITEAPCNLSLLETSLGWTWWGFCAIAGIGRNKTYNLSETKKKKKNSKMILLGSILGEGRWWCFLVLNGMRLCECFDFFFFFKWTARFFKGTTDKTHMTVHVSQTPGGAGASVLKSGIYKHLSDEKVWRLVGRAKVG